MLENMLTASDEDLFYCMYHLMEELKWKNMFATNSKELKSTVDIIYTKMEAILPDVHEHICELHQFDFYYLFAPVI